MADLLTNFKDSVHRASTDTFPVIGAVTTSDLPPQPATASVELQQSLSSSEAVSVERLAEETYSAELSAAEDIEVSDEGDERTISFEVPEIKLPAKFSSYDELATALVGNIVAAENLTSINTDFFGPVLINTAPKGFKRAKFGKHEFFIQSRSDRLVYIVEFLAKAKDFLITEKQYECNLAEPVNINGIIAYTLILTPKEILDITRSYPSYKFSYKIDDDISKMKLMIKA